jgi:hypothetical protein
MSDYDFMQFRLKDNGLLCLKTSDITSVMARTNGSRNTECCVNGHWTVEGYDFVLSALAANVQKVMP